MILFVPSGVQLHVPDLGTLEEIKEKIAIKQDSECDCCSAQPQGLSFVPGEGR
jgi:hypothetical protein